MSPDLVEKLQSLNLGAIYIPQGRAFEFAGLALNVYIGCEHQCAYCFNTRGPRAFARDPEHFAEILRVRKGILGALGGDIAKLQTAGIVGPSLFGEEGREVLPQVLLQFAGDPYPSIEKGGRITRRALELLHDGDVPHAVLTKGSRDLVRRDLSCFNAGRDAIATTIVFADEAKREHYEPQAETTAGRVDILAMARARGIETWLSVEPVIDPLEALKVVHWYGQFADHLKIGKPNHVRDDVPQAAWQIFSQNLAGVLWAKRLGYYIKRSLRPAWPRDVPYHVMPGEPWELRGDRVTEEDLGGWMERGAASIGQGG